MPTANKIDETLTESIVDGFLQYSVTQVWQVIADNRDDPPSAALSAVGVPPIGQVAVVAGTTAQVWCTHRQPVRVQPDQTGRKWYVTCQFTNMTQDFERDVQGNPVFNPVDAVKRIDINYLEYNAPVTDAILKSITKNGPYGSDNAVMVPNMPPWLSHRTNTPGPIVTSNNITVPTEHIAYRKIISISEVFDDWLPLWDTYDGAINTDSVTLQESDVTGVRWEATYKPFTLYMRPPYKQNIWKDQRLYFRRNIIMEHRREGWIHSQEDIGTKRYIYAGQSFPGYPNQGSTNFTAAELPRWGINGDWGTVEITTKSLDENDNEVDVAIGDPMPLNGWGMEQPTGRPDGDTAEVFYMNYHIEYVKAFAPLNL